jgi:hypothetical protein
MIQKSTNITINDVTVHKPAVKLLRPFSTSDQKLVRLVVRKLPVRVISHLFAVEVAVKEYVELTPRRVTFNSDTGEMPVVESDNRDGVAEEVLSVREDDVESEAAVEFVD